MRVCSYQLDCFSNSSLAHHSPCPLNLEGVGDATGKPLPVVAVGLVEKSVVEEEGKLEAARVEVVLKSSLKKPDGCSPRGVKKGRVKWMDFVGKELVEVREFEPLQSKELEEMMNGHPACMCIIQ